MAEISIKAKVNDRGLSDADKATLTEAVRFLEALEDRGMATLNIAFKADKPPKPPKAPKPSRPKMSPSERGRAGAAGLWGTKDNPKPRDARHVRKGRPKIPLHERSITPQMRAVWNTLSGEEYLLNSEIATKTGIDPAGVRNNLKLLKDRGLAENRASDIKKARGRFLVEWKRSVETLP